MKLTASGITRLKGVRTIKTVTCYDYQMACWLNETKLDAILVGDTVGEIIYGFPNSTAVTMDMMLRHTEAVCRGAPDIHVIGDMPFKSYDSSDLAVKNGRAFLNAGADSIKLENPARDVLTALATAKIPVCGHVGLTPQTIHNYKKQGTSPAAAQKIIDDSLIMQKYHCYATILEALPSSLSQKITHKLKIPTIGIAAGTACDGQIRVLYDITGLTKIEKSFAPPIHQLGKTLKEAIQIYIDTSY
ncbi:3-methyl-2-oxobutanoate hydroxymethyltransferase [Spirochaetota bacterium]|nr:3-methyl-2-oxobutanoate hydroxymethyltransferase [Spirochaetota bacterium]